MSEITTRTRSAAPRVIALPPTWGLQARGQIGDLWFELLVDGTPVSWRYLAPRIARVTDGAGQTHRLRVAGSGGVKTLGAHRRRGYAARLHAVYLETVRAQGYDAALLFCQAPHVAYNARLGYQILDHETVRVTYRQPHQDTPTRLPAHIWAGILGLHPHVPVTDLRAIDLEGLPW